jgi:hypothetical protein
MGNLDINQKDFTTRSGSVSSNVHQGNNLKSNSGKEKEKVYVSTGEWRIIMSAINHGTEVPANSRREVLMGYLHQHKKKLLSEKSELRKN